MLKLIFEIYKTDEERRILAIMLTVAGIIITIAGATLAYWNWQTNTAQKTLVNVTVTKDFECSVDGGGPIESTTYELAPTTCTDSTYAIKRQVTINPTIYGNNPIDMEVWLDVKDIGTGLTNSQNFRYALTTNENSCTDGVIESGTFNGKTKNSTVTILNKTYSATATETYWLYVWLDAAETSDSTMNQSFRLNFNGICEGASLTPEPNAPVLDTGMIPVTIANDGTVTTVSSTDSSWYDYSNQQWANAILVAESIRSSYQTPGKKVNPAAIIAYYVWIPRYKYKIFNTPTSSGANPKTIDIVFESKNTPKSTGTTVDEYLTHPAFTFGDQELDGFWVGKFETTGSASTPTILSNSTSLRSQSVSEQFQTSLKFAGGTLSDGNVTFIGSDTYGLTTNTDSHMMKNSEWGAVAYLSHSIYGINTEIRINNNSSYKTGCGASTANGSSTSECQIQYGKATEYPQSTTGNITGIYDMSGGASEYVMGVYSDSSGNPRSGLSSDYNSGFNGVYSSGSKTDGIDFPSSKYYDLYSITSNSSCTLATCGGHALYETVNWYSDYSNFVNSSYPWFLRGGYSSSGSDAGTFDSYNTSGDSSSAYSWRSILAGGTP